MVAVEEGCCAVMGSNLAFHMVLFLWIMASVQLAQVETKMYPSRKAPLSDVSWKEQLTS